MNFWNYVMSNWIDLALIFVGSFALITYILQERKKKTEAALMIIQQINEMQSDIINMSSSIVEHKLNEGAFYEMTPIIGEDYWAKYKHLFVKEMDANSFSNIDKLYRYVGVLQDQYNLLHNLQRNFFFVNQQVIANVETQLINSGLSLDNSLFMSNQNMQEGIASILESIKDEKQRDFFNQLIQRVLVNNPNMDLSAFWSYYNSNRSKLISIINQNALTEYIPAQIRISIEKTISQYSLLSIIGSEGYNRLMKISQRRL